MGRPSYRFLPDVALADVAFAARGDSPEALFEGCALAMTDVMVDRRSLRPTVKRELSMTADDLDGLLYDFLTQIIIMKDVDSLLFRSFRPQISKRLDRLSCKMEGEPIDRARHKLRNDVKAVTMHMFGIKREGGLWKATVVLDI